MTVRSCTITALTGTMAPSATPLRLLDGLSLFETLEFLEAGGVLVYGADFADLFSRSAIYVDKILKGARPADLPVEQPTKYVLGINNRVALQRGVVIPVALLARADIVIE